MVPIEESEEARLRPGRTLYTAETQVVPRSLEIAQIPQQLLNPECGALTDGRQLCRLEVRESQCWEVAVFLGEGGEAGDDDGEFGQEEGEALAEEDEVGVA